MDPSRVSFLLDPTEFYQRLCELYRNAQKRIVLACLYVGSGELEAELINSILVAKRRSQDLSVDILVDKTRTTRVGKNGRIQTHLSLLKPYLAPGNGVHISLFHNPLYGNFCSKVIKNPYCEAFGTMHLKAYIGDDECIITGANTARDYFCDRYDRYMVVNDALFCDTIHTFVKSFQTASYTFTENLTVEWLSDFINPMEDNMLFRKQLYVRTREMIVLCHKVLKEHFHDRSKETLGTSYGREDFTGEKHVNDAVKQGENGVMDLDSRQKQKKSTNVSGKPGTSVDEDIVDDKMKDCNPTKEHVIDGSGVATAHDQESSAETTEPKEQEYCNIRICLQVPFCEAPFVQGENLLDEYVLNYVRSGHSVFIATAYMNFTERFMGVLKKAIYFGKAKNKNPLQVATASPYANSFYCDGSGKRYIALFYSKAAMWLLNALKTGDDIPDDVYMEYNRPNHTFHAKGVWILNERVSLDAAHESQKRFLQETEPPISTVIGSSNYGRRSCAKDLEVIFFVDTNSEKLRKFMRQEIYEIAQHSDYVPYEVVSNRSGWIHLMACHLLKAFL